MKKMKMFLFSLTLCIAVVIGGYAFADSTEGISMEGALCLGTNVQEKQNNAATPGLVSSQSIAKADVIELQPFESGELEALLAEESASEKIGVSRNINQLQDTDSLNNILNWQPLKDGGHTASIIIKSPGAKALRIGIMIDQIPPEAELRFFEPDMENQNKNSLVTGAEIIKLVDLNLKAEPDNPDAMMYWSPIVAGESLGMEIYLPSRVDTDHFHIFIPILSHMGISPFRSGDEFFNDQGYGASNPCQNDVTCFATWAFHAKAVSKMIFTKSGYSYICTGTILNDKDTTTWVPYYITANHCISSQTVASTLNTLWMFQSSSCNGTTRHSSYTTLNGGATLLWTKGTTTAQLDSNQDATFLKLNDAVPAGTVFSGWATASPAINSTLTGIHHPKGDWKKYSTGTYAAKYKCWMVGTQFQCSASSTGSFLRNDWNNGGTEPGSSGSGIWNTSKRYVGDLKGGNGACPGSLSVYSSFGKAYSTGNLGKWLNTASSCLYAISPTSKSFGPIGGNGAVAVGPSSQTCTWTASESLSWVSIYSGSSGTGNGAAYYNVLPNTGVTRSGTITVAGKTHTIIQTGPSSSSHTYFIPMFKPQPGYWSGLGVRNLSNTSVAHISATIYRQNGTVLTTETKNIGAKGQDAFIIGSGHNSEGWVKVVSDQKLAGLNFSGKYKAGTTQYYLADVPFTDAKSTSLMIPHVAQTVSWDTTLYIANPNSSSASIKLTYTNKAGIPLTPYITSIPANGCKDISLNMVGGAGAKSGGSVTITSSVGVVAFALYNNLKTGSYSYAGINAVDLTH